jgi:hypothetical protein
MKLEKAQNSKFEVKNNPNYDLYQPGGGYIFLCKRHFRYFYNELPNCIEIDKIDSAKIIPFLKTNYGDSIANETSRKQYNPENSKLEIIEYFCFFKQKLLLIYLHDSIYILFSEKEKALATVLFEAIKKFKITPKITAKISLIINEGSSLKTKEIKITKPKLDLRKHYNDDFYLIHKKISKQLRENNSSGLFLLHGAPGTGKTTYLKYLLHLVKKKVIFISPKMAGNLDQHAMTEFLIDNQNAILVIEDAEELITSRNQLRNSSLSMLLNLTDGLLGESLGIQIIATFNTNVKNIDTALLRKGRLRIIYEFQKLEINKTNSLLLQIGHTIKSSEALSLASIFNYATENNTSTPTIKTIGFKAHHKNPEYEQK